MIADELIKYTKWIAWRIWLLFMLCLVLNYLPLGRDNSDFGEWGERSGLAVRTDAFTSCEYLESSGGGLIPRVGRDGKQKGCIHE